MKKETFIDFLDKLEFYFEKKKEISNKNYESERLINDMKNDLYKTFMLTIFPDFLK